MNGLTWGRIPGIRFLYHPSEKVTLGLSLENATQYFGGSGGGGSINANVELVKNLRLVTNNYWSDGGGRYLFGVAPDFIVRADGSPSLIHSGSTVSGFEFQHKNTQLYAYYGGIYIGRNTALDANGTSRIGYGYITSPNSHNKTTQEGSLGFTQTAWRDARYGALQVMFQYAYFFGNPWHVAAGAPKSAHENAVWFNLPTQPMAMPPCAAARLYFSASRRFKYSAYSLTSDGSVGRP